MNEVASPCCGSCGWYCWNSYLEKYTCHNPEIVKQHKQNDFIPESLCVPSYYSPRNPIPITNLPGVKELVDTLRTLVDAIDWAGGKDSFSTERAHRILKILEAKDE